MVFSLIIILVHQLYSYVPLFTQYLLNTFETNPTGEEVNLPIFILEIFAKGQSVFSSSSNCCNYLSLFGKHSVFYSMIR